MNHYLHLSYRTYHIVPAPEIKAEEKSKKTQLEKEPKPIEESEPILELINESMVEVIPAPVKSSISAKGKKSAKLTKSVENVETGKSAKSALEVEPLKESESANISESIQESVSIAEMEPTVHPENIMELEVPEEPIIENVVSNESTEMKNISDKVEDEKGT